MNRQSSVLRVTVLFMVALGLVPLLRPPVSQAQTTSITSSGLNTQVTVSAGAPVPTYNITGGTRPGNGPNLFHSFGDFSVGTHDRALFLNDSGLATTNILGRVTGGHPSNIFGNITTTSFQGANLYLINPAGVVFGPSASLNVSGSVTVSTADYLRLADGLRFNAVPGPQDALLSQAPVVAFGFLNPHPRPISVQGATLDVQQHTPDEPKRSVTLVGGDINLSGGTLKAEGGIELVSVASRGEVRADHLVFRQSPMEEVRTEGLPTGVRLGTIRMTNALLDTAAPEVGSPRGAGPIVIRGGQLVMDHSTISASIGPFSLAEQFNGTVTIQMTDSVRANESHIVSNGGGFTHGDVSLEAGQAIRLTNSTVESDNVTGNPGVNLATVTLNAPEISLDGTHVSATGHSPCCAASAAGSIVIQADKFSMKNGSELVATGAEGIPNIAGGNVVINATDTVRIDRSRIDVSGLQGFNVPIPTVDAGNISITAGRTVSLQNQSVLAANGGNGGNIVIDAGKNFVSQGHSSLSAESFGLSPVGHVSHAGSILIQAPERILIDGGLISTRAHDDQTGGNISLTSDVARLRNATVQSTAVNGPGGTITIKANDFRKLNSTVDVNSQFGPDGTISLP